MRTLPTHTPAIFRLRQLLLLAALLTCVAGARALPAAHYAANSRLQAGKWVKINVSTTGVQRITYTQLRSMGFTNPERVNVYGYGGQRMDEGLTAATCTDDLPRLLTLHEGDALCFWGVNTIKWKVSSVVGMGWSQVQNPYSTESCYFLSDVDAGDAPPEARDCRAEAVNPVTSFTERTFHEKEMYNAGQMGTLFFGEDFRIQPSQTFSFNTPGRIDDRAMAAVSFGVKTSGGTASISISANGVQLPSTSSDSFAGLSDSERFFVNQVSYKEITDKSEKIDIKVDFKAGGALQLARLDFITLTYKRALRLDNSGYLYFYTTGTTDSTRPLQIEGCTAATRIWDVTDPAAPFEIHYSLAGGKGTFTPPGPGAREYVAFTPAGVTRQPVEKGKVANQDLHSLPAPDMVIFTPGLFKAQAERVADLHRRHDEMSVIVLTPDEVYNEFSSGSPELTAFRKLMKMWYDREEKPGYCLLFGRPTYDNRGITDAVKSQGYPHFPIWQSDESRWALSSISTDDYIAMLEDNPGGLNMGTARLCVSVGRFPVKSEREAREMVDKLIKYVEEPEFGAWRNNILLVADDQDNAIHYDQAQEVYGILTGTERGRGYRYDRLYLDSYPQVQTGTGAGYPEARNHFYRAIDQGVMYMDYIGHANPKSWTHEGFMRYEDIVGMNNTRLPIIFTYSCEFVNWDNDDISGGELMFLNPTAGVIAMMAASRSVYMTPNGALNSAMNRHLVAEDTGILRLGDIYTRGKNDMRNDTNKLCFLLMGDPAMRFPSPEYKVVVDAIGGIPPEEGENAPVIMAQSRVRIAGRVTDAGGNTAGDFNGILTPMLYDAERVVETYGNGPSGVKCTYNDRKNLLYTGKVKVENGLWETTVLMPSEIDNNYSPALLSLYAYSDDSREANGSTTGFYVYGWDDSIDDTEGPEVLAIGMNNPAFKDGGTVNTTPLFISTVRDPSGINISQAGIGHSMTLTVDGSKVYDDITEFFEPDEEDSTVGHIRYLLPEQEPGSHKAVLTVWDNAGNSTMAELNYKVSLTEVPNIYDVTTDVNPATTSVTFTISHDRPQGAVDCNVEIFDLSGRKVWDGTSGSTRNAESSTTWNLTDGSGNRVPRGIYLYRARVRSASGVEATKTKKLAVTAP